MNSTVKVICALEKILDGFAVDQSHFAAEVFAFFGARLSAWASTAGKYLRQKP